MTTRAALSLRDLVGARSDELAELAAAMVRVPTVTGEEGAIVPLVVEWAHRHDLTVEVTALQEAVDATTEHFRQESDLAGRCNVVVWLGDPRGGAILTVNAHIDVVPAIDRPDWREEPFSGARRDGRIHGRGSVDTKGGAAAALHALLALADAGGTLPFAVGVELVAAEETTGLGTRLTLQQRPERIGTIVVEPTGNRVIVANSGVLFFTVEVDGRAAHTSQPERGVNALEKAIRLHEAIAALGARRAVERRHPLMAASASAVPVVVGAFSGGGFRAAVPAHARFSGRVGVLPGESLDDVRAEMARVIAEVADRDPWLRAHPPRLVWDSEGSPGWEVPADGALPQALLTGQNAAGLPQEYGGLTSGCDAGIILDAGVPVVVFGPGDIALAHSSDEWVAEDDLVAAAVTLAAGIDALAHTMNPEASR